MNEARVSENSLRYLRKRFGSTTGGLFFLPIFLAIIAATTFAKSADNFFDSVFSLLSLVLLVLSIVRFILVFSELPNLSRGFVILGYLTFSICMVIPYYHYDSSPYSLKWRFIVFVAGAFLFVLLDVFYFEKRFSQLVSNDEKPKQPTSGSQTQEPPPIYTRKELVEHSGILFLGMFVIGMMWLYKYDDSSHFFYFQMAAIALSLFQFTLSYARLESWLRATMIFIYAFFLIFPFLPYDRWDIAFNQDYIVFLTSIMTFQQCQHAFSERL
ncbi:hypothetical protein [Rhodobium gokarnense]|uniref:Multidrug transporter EmrE-like cation transporter n=1 Tax=Rhodobium gokarnense TaxID=364296 RepID=A0ABT3H5W4_9HYPH|nr:hypothetical protein [Rhodobium gokarnense]MCW2305785.1 multidrug transporter EmrE-like cation transporter [Rhodobium gokarnense]